MWILLVYLFGFVLFLWALYLSYIFAAPVAAAVAGVVAVGMVVVEYASATAEIFRGTAPIGHLRIEPPQPGTSADRRDPAYRSYFFGPVFRDYALALRVASQRGWERLFVGGPVQGSSGASAAHRPALIRRIITAWKSIGTKSLPGAGAMKIIASGPMVGGVAGVAIGALGAAALGLMVSLVFGFVLGLALAGVVVCAGLLRVVELSLLQLRGITLECSSCHRRAVSPVYLCPYCPDGNGALHRRLVPGPFGVFSRVCRCGNSIPTLLARGKWKLLAYCQHEDCNKPLPVKGLTAPTFHVPVVAGRSAGKTVFMMAAVASLERQARSTGDVAAFEFADPTAKQNYLSVKSALEQAAFGGIKATLPQVSVQAFNIYLGAERSSRRRLLYLYDAAGERYETSDGVSTFRFLDFTEGIVLIVDPFSFDGVQRVVQDDFLADLRYSRADADEVFGRFAQTLRENLQTRANRKMDVPIAVVLTKCDALLAAPDIAHPYDQLGDAAQDPEHRSARSDAVRDWLKSVAGQHAMVASLENTFGRCGYFAVSALDAFKVHTRSSGRTRAAVRHDDTSAPLSWLLEKGVAK